MMGACSNRTLGRTEGPVPSTWMALAHEIKRLEAAAAAADRQSQYESLTEDAATAARDLASRILEGRR